MGLQRCCCGALVDECQEWHDCISSPNFGPPDLVSVTAYNNKMRAGDSCSNPKGCDELTGDWAYHTEASFGINSAQVVEQCFRATGPDPASCNDCRCDSITPVGPGCWFVTIAVNYSLSWNSCSTLFPGCTISGNGTTHITFRFKCSGPNGVVVQPLGNPCEDFTDVWADQCDIPLSEAPTWRAGLYEYGAQLVNSESFPQFPCACRSSRDVKPDAAYTLINDTCQTLTQPKVKYRMWAIPKEQITFYNPFGLGSISRPCSAQYFPTWNQYSGFDSFASGYPGLQNIFWCEFEFSLTS